MRRAHIFFDSMRIELARSRLWLCYQHAVEESRRRGNNTRTEYDGILKADQLAPDTIQRQQLGDVGTGGEIHLVGVQQDGWTGSNKRQRGRVCEIDTKESERPI